MQPVPCKTCGYDAPLETCPHCGHRPAEPSLAQPGVGALSGVLTGFAAVPMGLLFLARTRGVKRWLVPPLILTTVILVVALTWTFAALNELIEGTIPADIEFGEGRWEWLMGLGEGWNWLKSTWLFLVAAAEWTTNQSYDLITSRSLRFVSYFLVSSLVAWYCFSIAYEAFAGPFLDEVQARLEARWFGSDPRSRLERPNDIPVDTCIRLSWIAGSVAGLLLALGFLTPWVPWWAGLLAALLPFVVAARIDRRYGPWLRWVASVETRALVASLQAALVTGVLIVLALPLYFVPGVGYFMFAGVTGFATAVGLLDIPFERRAWRLGLRLRFLFRNLPALIAFGVTAGALLAIPLAGPVLMVPGASIGGLWLVCRIDKQPERSAELRRTGRLDGPAPESA